MAGEVFEHAGSQFEGHEVGSRGEGVAEGGGSFRGESEAGVVVGWTEHNDGFEARVSEHGDAHVDERSANAAALEIGMDGEWSESRGENGATGGFDGERRVKDLACEAATGFGHQFQGRVSIRAEPIDEIGFVSLIEGALKEVADFRIVFRRSGAKSDHGVFWPAGGGGGWPAPVRWR